MDHDHSLLFGMASIGAASSVVVGRTPQIAVLAQAVLGVGIEKRVPPVGLEQPLDIARGGHAGGERAFAGEFEPSSKHLLDALGYGGDFRDRTVADCLRFFFSGIRGTTRPFTQHQPRSGSRFSRCFAAIPSISSTAFSSARSIHSATSSVSQWTMGATISNG